MSVSYNNIEKVLKQMNIDVNMEVFKSHCSTLLMDVAMPFGKYKGQNVSEICKMDKGINYLKWVQKWIESLDGEDNFTELAAVLEDYFGDLEEPPKKRVKLE